VPKVQPTSYTSTPTKSTTSSPGQYRIASTSLRPLFTFQSNSNRWPGTERIAATTRRQYVTNTRGSSASHRDVRRLNSHPSRRIASLWPPATSRVASSRYQWSYSPRAPAAIVADGPSRAAGRGPWTTR
jgi:hypothetical protein